MQAGSNGHLILNNIIWLTLEGLGCVLCVFGLSDSLGASPARCSARVCVHGDVTLDTAHGSNLTTSKQRGSVCLELTANTSCKHGFPFWSQQIYQWRDCKSEQRFGSGWLSWRSASSQVNCFFFSPISQFHLG